jgi:hypothetical protein
MFPSQIFGFTTKYAYLGQVIFDYCVNNLCSIFPDFFAEFN